MSSKYLVRHENIIVKDFVHQVVLLCWEPWRVHRLVDLSVQDLNQNEVGRGESLPRELCNALVDDVLRGAFLRHADLDFVGWCVEVACDDEDLELLG